MNLTKQEKIEQKFNRLKRKVEDYQRGVFHKIFSTNPAQLYKELENHRTALDKLHRKRVINQQQYDLIFPANQQTNSQLFDSTLLQVLLRNCCGFTKPITGWNDEPDVNDHTTMADVIRLNHGRNEISHASKSKVTQKHYQKVYKKLKEPLKRLGCTHQELQELLPTPVHFKLQSVSPSFVGRQNELHQIHQEILSSKQKKVYKSMVIKSKTNNLNFKSINNI